MNQSEIESKIRKLLALSESDNPHEAAAAAARAQQLITKYKIEKMIEAGEDFEIPEIGAQIDFPLFSYTTQRPPKWKWRIACAIAMANNCQPWHGRSGGRKICFCIGGAEDAAHAQSLYDYVERLITKMRDKKRPIYVTGGKKRSWNHSFETGASLEIWERLSQQTSSMRDKLEASQESSVALQKIDETMQAIDGWMEKEGMSFQHRRRRISVGEAGAFACGRDAGKSINLGNTNQKALKGR